MPQSDTVKQPDMDVDEQGYLGSPVGEKTKFSHMRDRDFPRAAESEDTRGSENTSTVTHPSNAAPEGRYCQCGCNAPHTDGTTAEGEPVTTGEAA